MLFTYSLGLKTGMYTEMLFEKASFLTVTPGFSIWWARDIELRNPTALVLCQSLISDSWKFETMLGFQFVKGKGLGSGTGMISRKKKESLFYKSWMYALQNYYVPNSIYVLPSVEHAPLLNGLKWIADILMIYIVLKSVNVWHALKILNANRWCIQEQRTHL